ncbi:MAG: thiamine-phosphate kinase [Gammaproteobacteria bacterium]
MSLNEFEIIDRYFKSLTGEAVGVTCGIGDDAAVIGLPTGMELVTSVDTLISGVHFQTDTDPYDIGFKSLAVNLSDIAAMAAEPRWVTLALTVPENNPAWLESFARGFADLAKRYSVSLIGGDLTRGPLSITVQILGTVPCGAAIKRSGAVPGDSIYVSGCLGGAGFALKVLNGECNDTEELSAECLTRLLRPIPRIELGAGLRGLASAVIDISDGLAVDLGHILRASSVGAVIELGKVPVCDALAQITDEDILWQTALCSGDDYELCFTLPVSNCRQLQRMEIEMDCSVTCIGRIVENEAIRWLQSDGSEYDLRCSGYRHF